MKLIALKYYLLFVRSTVRILHSIGVGTGEGASFGNGKKISPLALLSNFSPSSTFEPALERYTAPKRTILSDHGQVQLLRGAFTTYPHTVLTGIMSAMEFRNSKILDRGRYRGDGLAHGISLRIYNDPYREIAGVLKAQKDWSNLVSPVRNHHGGFGNLFS
jgi:hypothetical protein